MRLIYGSRRFSLNDQATTILIELRLLNNLLDNHLLTPTALTLDDLRESLSNILWLAANKGISEHVKTYAEQVHGLLVKVDSTNMPNLRNELFSLAVGKCEPRIKSYGDNMQDLAKKCLHLVKGARTLGGIPMFRRSLSCCCPYLL